MVRKKGDRNFKPRKDKGKARKTYRGKSVLKKVKRKGRMIPYKSIKRRGDNVKIWFWEIKKMTKSGRMMWNKDIRPYIRPVTYHFGVQAEVKPEDISSKEAVEQTSLDLIGHTGNFYMMMFGHKKNIFHSSPQKVCQINITESEEGLRANMIQNFKLWRYYFWKGGR